jgi:hypothetical protein
VASAVAEAMAQSTVGWPDAVAQLAQERLQAQACVDLLRATGDKEDRLFLSVAKAEPYRGGVRREREGRSELGAHVCCAGALKSLGDALHGEEAERRIGSPEREAVATRSDVENCAVARDDILALAPAGGVKPAQDHAQLAPCVAARDERRAVARLGDA